MYVCVRERTRTNIVERRIEIRIYVIKDNIGKIISVFKKHIYGFTDESLRFKKTLI